MKSYRFRLATVSRIRALEERVARDRLAMSLRERRHAEDVLRASKQGLLNCQGPLGVLSIDDFNWSADQAERLSCSVLASYEAWRAASDKCDDERHAWREASQRAGALERLDDSARAMWRDETMRHEILELDDLTNSRFTAGRSRR